MKVLITGYGRMGRLIEDTLVKAGDEIAGWIDIENVAELDSSEKIADIIMDFSNPSLTDTVVAYAARTGTPFLSGTTNMTPEQHESLAKLAQNIPVIWASNYSLGINLFMHILPQVKAALPDWDIEITETHHNKKVDAPSGTAKSLADAIDPDGEYERVYGRSGNCGERTKREIGLHAGFRTQENGLINDALGRQVQIGARCKGKQRDNKQEGEQTVAKRESQGFFVCF